MRPTVTVTSDDLTRFLTTFLDRSLEATNDVQMSAVLHILGSTINKTAPGESTSLSSMRFLHQLMRSFTDAGDFLDRDLKTFWTTRIVDASVHSATRKAALRAWSWITKGLIARSDPRGYDAVTAILGLFLDPVLGRDSATALGVIADDSDRVLSKENFAILRVS